MWLDETRGIVYSIHLAGHNLRQNKSRILKMRNFVAYFLIFFSNNQNMKKLIVVLVIIVAIILVGIILPTQEKDYDYLRLHIRANSNSVVDQNVKYEIKDKMVSILTPFLCDVSSKAEAIKIVNRNKTLIQIP